MTGCRVGRTVLIRADAGGGTHEFLDYLSRRRLAYSIGFGLTATMAAQLALIPGGGVDPGLRRRRQGSRWRLGRRRHRLLELSGWPPGCGSLCARNAPIPERSYGSSIPTGRKWLNARSREWLAAHRAARRPGTIINYYFTYNLNAYTSINQLIQSSHSLAPLPTRSPARACSIVRRSTCTR